MLLGSWGEACVLWTVICAACSTQAAEQVLPSFLGRCVVVIEKDAIFQRLVDDGFAEQTRSILVTAKGVPDRATRAFLHALTTCVPHLCPMAGTSQLVLEFEGLMSLVCQQNDACMHNCHPWTFCKLC